MWIPLRGLFGWRTLSCMSGGSGVVWRLGHRPALDGLRGVAIALVVAGHAALLPGNAGPIGVTVFFTLSGFLITSLLLGELATRGRISLSRFYGRRARRLFPALGVYLAVSVLLTLTGAAVYDFALSEYLGPMLYVENWLMVINGRAEQITAITWSLSIEEQFYLVWPPVLLMSARTSWRWPLIVATVGTLAAPALRLWLWDGGDGHGRIYYGSDTRMDCLLIGCLLAIVVTQFGVSNWWRTWWPLGVLLIAVPLGREVSVHLWLPTVVAAGTCVVIAAVLAQGARWFEWTPLRWLGRRSYALYLWHYPLVYVFARELGLMSMWVAILASLALAEASWWLVERPFLRRPPHAALSTTARRVLSQV